MAPRNGQPVVGRLGKAPARVDRRTLNFAQYLHPTLPPAPTAKNWTDKVVDWQMLGNDRYGDCVEAAALHMEQNWSAYEGPVEFEPTEKEALDAYTALTGFQAGDPSTDRGTNMLDALNSWRTDGIGGNQIFAFAACEPGNTEHLRNTIELFGAAYIGLQMPYSAQGQSVWMVPPGGPVGPGQPNSWGGHCVPVVGYTPTQLICVTWGKLQPMTWQFFRTYCDEAYAVLSKQWADTDRPDPDGFTLDLLRQDLAAIPG
ncbi:hypothetical protein [Streptomyces alanosinicus]|uniref:Uncharacterized protein n=1 Tax=Streptomyces alanosinicus TaxID=68171 RepID=A0A919D6C6_9ACTN|nr:hypothetical protein [Streptomyces alanosinicus]GHE08493.1 hypothetical protein GCM10010339_57280 [Streptomyces alanosinicus]